MYKKIGARDNPGRPAYRQTERGGDIMMVVVWVGGCAHRHHNIGQHGHIAGCSDTLINVSGRRGNVLHAWAWPSGKVTAMMTV